jgi:hypothetical protein
MNELDLYKFCQDKELDWHGEELILWVCFYDLKEFADLLGYNYLSEGGMGVTLLSDCIALAINDLCEDSDIDPERILEKPE